MEHILSEIGQQMCLTKKFIISRNRIIAAVDFHRRALELVNCLSKLCHVQVLLVRVQEFSDIVITNISSLLQIASH